MRLARIAGVGLLVATLGAMAAPPSRQPIFPGRIAAPSENIDCSLSPFGKSAPVIDDLEPILMLYGPNGAYDDEYDGNQAPPLPRVYRANLFQSPLPALPPLKSVSADLNGDGQDEVVVAYSDGNYVRLAVYQRALEPGATALLIDFWTDVEGMLPDTIDLVAGDFVGGKDKKKQLAVSWKVAATGAIHVMILQGDASGQIGPADSFANGKWIGQAGVAFPHLAVGDFLLAGRDQLVLAGYQQSTGSIELDLIDYNNPFFFVLPTVGQANTRSAHFSDGLNVAFNTPSYAIDDAPAIAMQGSSPGGGVLDDMRVNGGDVVDTAADELVVHVMFPEPTTPVSRVLAQRVLHFTTTRDVNKNITAIALGDPSIISHNFDSSIKLERYNGDPSFTTVGPRFAAAIADVDVANKREIITARAGHDGTSGVFDGSLVWFAHQVHVRVVPSYQYKNQGSISGEPVVKFINNSRGDIRSYSWDFGDGTTGPDKDPQHAFPLNSHAYTVKLTATLFDDTQVVYTDTVTPNSANDANPQGGGTTRMDLQDRPTTAFQGQRRSLHL